MSFESLGFAYHRGVDSNFTHTLNWTQILLILCKRPNKVYLIKMLKHQAQAGFGTKKWILCVLSFTSTQDLLQASQFLRLKYNILKKMSLRDIALI